MYAYRCPGCGATAYRSANAPAVRACPRCSMPLAVPGKAMPRVAPSPTPQDDGAPR